MNPQTVRSLFLFGHPSGSRAVARLLVSSPHSPLDCSLFAAVLPLRHSVAVRTSDHVAMSSGPSKSPTNSSNNNAAAAAVTSSISADERLLLCSLLETQQFGPAVKAIYDRQWYASGEYQTILQESVHSKQSQIKQICEEHYAEFLAGIDHLLAVKLDLSELRSLAQSLNLSVQQSGRAVLASARQLNEQRRLRYQINSAKQILQSCASLIALARKAKQQIYHSKYFSALKTLNQLQRILHVAATNFHKSNASSDAAPSSPSTAVSSSSSSSSSTAAASAVRFEFIQQLERQIPLLTGKIKESVRAEFTAWLNGISKRSQAIGELALAQLDEHLTASTKKSEAKRIEAREKRTRKNHGGGGGNGGAGGQKKGRGKHPEESDEEDTSWRRQSHQRESVRYDSDQFHPNLSMSAHI